MSSPRLADTYLKVKDMDRAVSFYETFLGVKAEYRFFQFPDTEGNVVEVGQMG